jgi:hypothetical protein
LEDAVIGYLQGSFCLYASQLDYIAKGRRFELREWEVVFDQLGDGRKPKLLYIEVGELVSNSLRAALRQGAFEESFFARSDGSTLT